MANPPRLGMENVLTLFPDLAASSLRLLPLFKPFSWRGTLLVEDVQ
jgi:hypothetical protein